jgi:hypothetical protein
LNTVAVGQSVLILADDSMVNEWNDRRSSQHQTVVIDRLSNEPQGSTSESTVQSNENEELHW